MFTCLQGKLLKNSNNIRNSILWQYVVLPTNFYVKKTYAKCYFLISMHNSYELQTKHMDIHFEEML